MPRSSRSPTACWASRPMGSDAQEARKRLGCARASHAEPKIMLLQAASWSRSQPDPPGLLSPATGLARTGAAMDPAIAPAGARPHLAGLADLLRAQQHARNSNRPPVRCASRNTSAQSTRPATNSHNGSSHTPLSSLPAWSCSPLSAATSPLRLYVLTAGGKSRRPRRAALPSASARSPCRNISIARRSSPASRPIAGPGQFRSMGRSNDNITACWRPISPTCSRRQDLPLPLGDVRQSTIRSPWTSAGSSRTRTAARCSASSGALSTPGWHGPAHAPVELQPARTPGSGPDRQSTPL
jgi:hypothetical protein